MHSATLLMLAASAGVFLIAAVIVLLYQRRIYIDAATGQPTEIEMPLLGRMKTQNSVIAMILVGAGLVLGAAILSKPDMLTLEGTVKNPGHRKYEVFVVAEPAYELGSRQALSFSRRIPALPDASYTLWFQVDGSSFDQPAKLEKGRLTVNEVDLQMTHEDGDAGIVPVKEVSDEEARKFGK